jgi:hypothetical protein
MPANVFGDIESRSPTSRSMGPPSSAPLSAAITVAPGGNAPNAGRSGPPARTTTVFTSHRLPIQRETDWIDFKREAYKKDDHGKLELAKDVAAFANADGGLLVLGFATTKSGHVETASKIFPCAIGAVSVQSYRAVLARRIHPPPEHVEIFSIPYPGGNVWVVSVPPQPEEYKPFLVHGAVINSKVNDSYFSIVSRRDDEAVPTDPQGVHALIAAGRAVLRAPARRLRAPRASRRDD